ncbi:MAG: glycosyltransferase family 39 protein, partial [Acidobacteriales bacterium]|nr:glycosyltransferase family 39 protein [Terriglobales bacterium]
MSTNTSSLNPITASTPEPHQHWGSKWKCYVILAIIIAGAALVRFRLRAMPLERDEGEYAYIGQLMLHGIAPYRVAYSMKLPGTYVFYALLLTLFGQTPAGVHEGLILVNVLTLCLLAMLAARLFGPTAATVSAASYALLSLSPSVLGFAGHATHFVVLWAVAAALLLSGKRRSTGILFACGLLLGVAFLMKQPGILFAVFAALFLIRETIRSANLQSPRWVWAKLAGRLAALGAGVLLPFLLTCLLLWRAGVFSRFWFWTFTYARQYAAIVSLREGARNLWASIPGVVGPGWTLWVLAGVGLTALYWDRRIRERSDFMLPFLVCSFLAVCAGLYFRQHYFILMLPAVALLIGAGISSFVRSLKPGWIQVMPVVLFLAAWGFSLLKQEDFLFRVDPVTACRAVYGPNPFPEALEIANYIRSHSPPGSRLAVLGSEPEIPFYADRLSATGYIYTY